MFWAFSGFTWDRDTGYSLNDTIRSQLGDAKILSIALLNRVKAELMEKIRTELPRISKEEPAFYAENVEGKIVSFVIIARTNRIAFTCDSKVSGVVAARWDCATSPDSQGRTAKFILGDNDPARIFTSQNRSMPALSLIGAVFPLSVKALPNSIGGKISILRIPAVGNAGWIDPGECPSVTAYR
jgi:hypothetical protein